MNYARLDRLVITTFSILMPNSAKIIIKIDQYRYPLAAFLEFIFPKDCNPLKGKAINSITQSSGYNLRAFYNLNCHKIIEKSIEKTVLLLSSFTLTGAYGFINKIDILPCNDFGSESLVNEFPCLSSHAFVDLLIHQQG